MRNNQVSCVPCNKLIVFLPVFNKKKTLTGDLGRLIEVSPIFEEILWFSLMDKQKQAEQDLNETIKKFQLHEESSGVVPSYFVIEKVLLPSLAFLYENDENFEQGNNYLVYFKILLLILILLMLLLGLLSLDNYFKYKAKEYLCK